MAKQAKALALFVLLLMVSGSAMGSFTCDTVLDDLNPCLSYLREEQAEPSAQCCNGAREVGSYFNSKTDRQAVCECLQVEGPRLGNIHVLRIMSLPVSCAVSVNLPPIGSDGRLDCSR